MENDFCPSAVSKECFKIGYHAVNTDRLFGLLSIRFHYSDILLRFQFSVFSFPFVVCCYQLPILSAAGVINALAANACLLLIACCLLIICAHPDGVDYNWRPRTGSATTVGVVAYMYLFALPSRPMTQEQIKDMRSRLAGLGRYL